MQRPTSHVTAIRDGLPELIASLQKLYPNAIYGFLGRDTSLASNAMQAVYDQYGQGERIQFINLSTPIFSAMTPDQLVQYLISLGLSPGKESNRPFVIVDWTSFNSGSQSTQLARAVTQYFRNRGLSESDIIERFNVVTLTGERVKVLPLTPEEIQEKKNTQATEMKDGLAMRSIFSTSTSLRGMAYSSPWHDTFATVTTDPNGKLVAIPKQSFQLSNRTNTFQEFISLIKEVTTPEYLSRLQSYLLEQGQTLHPVDSPQYAEIKEKIHLAQIALKEQKENAEREKRRLEAEKAKRAEEKLFHEAGI